VGQYPGGGAGLCMPAPTGDECYDTEDCPENFFCLGAQECSCDMNCVSDPGTCAPLAGDCCFTNEECPDGYTCAESKMGGGPGVCEPLPPAGKCWNDEDCGGDFQFCKDAWACPCNADCDGLDKLGDCYCEPDACCCPALGCGAGMECVPVPGGGEACKPVPGAGMCWTDADCGADEACVGAIPCDCWWGEEGDGCDIPGSCIALPYDCCKTDQDCQAGFTCVGADMGGVCEPVPEPGKCWSDADCYMSQECVGMSFCPCGMECGLASMPGTCSPLPVGCCYTDKECGDGMECKGIWPGSELPGSCVPSHLGPACMGDAACCWDAADCNQYGDENGCIGASVCGCIALCPVCGACQPDQMGMCGI
jgi:hypothetical protein